LLAESDFIEADTTYNENSELKYLFNCTAFVCGGCQLQGCVLVQKMPNWISIDGGDMQEISLSI
jgi:hypothetical protein